MFSMGVLGANLLRAGGSGGTASYWRIRAITGPTYTSFYEIEMRGSIGGADQCSGGAALSHGDFAAWAVAENAFDNSLSTRWAGSTGVAYPGRFIGYQFPSSIDVLEMSARIQNNEGPTRFVIERSEDGSVWTEDGYGYSLDNWAWGEGASAQILPIYREEDIGAGEALAWRMRFYNSQDGTYLSFGELAFRESSGGANSIALPDSTNNWITTSGDFFGASTRLNLLDGDSSSRWASATSPAWGDRFYIVRYSVPRQITEVAIRSASGYASEAPTDFALESSNDQVTWTEVKRWTTPATWASAEERVFSV